MYFDTVAEYDAEIAAWRTGLRNLATSQRYTISTTGGSRELWRVNLDDYRSYLKELISERGMLAGTGAVRRTYAKCGRGRG
jgi:hypothetical protein